MKTITILTPTYNREEHLTKLYESLCRQSNQDFCWMIVDDGSQDGTVGLIRKFIAEEKVDILLFTQSNGGKHTALNLGLKQIETELTYIVDSDDYLPENAIQIILDYHEKYKKDREKYRLCGYSFLRFYSNGEVNTAYFPKDEEIDTYLQVRINGGIGGDKAEVFYTDVLKEYPFPEYPGERFMPEDVVWMQMSDRYKMVHINQCVYISDYLEGGLTTSGRRMKLRSPKGMVLRSQIYLNHPQVKYKVKIKMMLLYHVYGKAAGYSLKELMGNIRPKVLFIGCLIPGRVLYHRWMSNFGTEH